MSDKFRAQMAKAEADRQAAETKRKADDDARARQFRAGNTAASTLDSYDQTIRHGGRDNRLAYNDTNSFEWGPWLLRKILLGFNGFFIVLGVIVMILGGVASQASFSSVAGKSWTVGIAMIGVLILILGVVGALGAYTKNRLILMIYVVFLVCMLIVVFILGVFIAASSPSTLIRTGWDQCSNDSKTTLQDHYVCCGLDNVNDQPGSPCPNVMALNTSDPSGNSFYPVPTTTPCMPIFSSAFDQNFSAMGWMGVVISITMGVCMLFAFFLIRMVTAAAPRYRIDGVLP